MQIFSLFLSTRVLSDYHLLHPGRPGFGVRPDDDVVVPEREVVPDGRVEVVVLEFPLFDRPVAQ